MAGRPGVLGTWRLVAWKGVMLPGVTQGSNPDLLHCRQILYYLSHQGQAGQDRGLWSRHLKRRKEGALKILGLA